MLGNERVGRSDAEPAEPMSMTPKPSRRVAALATLAFASAASGGGASAAAATAAQRNAPAPQRGTAQRPAPRPEHAATSRDARLQLPAELELQGFATELGIHPGRLAATLRRLTPDASGSIDGLDPLTALAHALNLPPTDVYLAAARFAARA